MFGLFVVVKLSTLRVGWFVMEMGDICAVILTLHRQELRQNVFSQFQVSFSPTRRFASSSRF